MAKNVKSKSVFELPKSKSNCRTIDCTVYTFLE